VRFCNDLISLLSCERNDERAAVVCAVETNVLSTDEVFAIENASGILKDAQVLPQVRLVQLQV
jgi:hypothetical protein